MNDCIFCKLARKEIPHDRVAESDGGFVFAIRDKLPLAPEHFLVISKAHFATISEFVTKESPASLLEIITLATKIGDEKCPNGYRLMINSGADAGQTVKHAHVHVIGGAKLPDHPSV